MPNPHRLRVLLIDDMPMLSAEDGVCRDLAPYVELKWLGNEESTKRFLEVSMQFDRVAPQELLNVVPELVIIDYNLNKPTKHFDHLRVDFNELEAKISERGIDTTPSQRPSRRSARTGAVLGILIANCFRAYPCLAYPASGVPKGQEAADALLEELEWCLDEGQYKNFDQRGSETDFNKIIANAMPDLRARLFELAKSQLISLSLYELASLASGIDASQLDNCYLSFTSRFGRRSISIAALFLDIAIAETGDEGGGLEQLASAATQWTQALWRTVLQLSDDNTATSIRLAVIHSKKIWDAFCHDFDERHELSDLCKKRTVLDGRSESLSQEEKKRLQTLYTRFSVEEEECKIFTMVTSLKNKEVMKWSALLLAVQYVAFVSSTIPIFQSNADAVIDSPSQMSNVKVQTYLNIDRITSLDLNFIWFPVLKKPLILNQANFDSSSPHGKKLSRLGITGEGVLNGKINDVPFEPQVRAVLQAFARGLGFVDWPLWLRGQ